MPPFGHKPGLAAYEHEIVQYDDKIRRIDEQVSALNAELRAYPASRIWQTAEVVPADGDDADETTGESIWVEIDSRRSLIEKRDALDRDRAQLELERRMVMARAKLVKAGFQT